MSTNGLSSSELKLETLNDPGDRYKLDYLLGSGVYSDVYVALDSQAGGKKVAVKIQSVVPEFTEDIQEEYRILRDLSDHTNLPDFYGAYLKKGKNSSERDQLWFVMQLCEGGPVIDLVRGLQNRNKKMNEEHIAYILRETVKALVHLHENHVIHRDVRGSNILLTKDGEVKLVDFGLSREVMSTEGKRFSSLGSPCWMAPEVVTSGKKEGSEILSYDNRADVWAVGITAVELGDGKPPFQDMHPTRALFQIVRNPPPTLYRPANWSQNYNDFITECLEKNQENRPYMVELLEHPFLTSLPENDFHFPQELKVLLDSVTPEIKSSRKEEVAVRKSVIQKKISLTPEPMHVEDLAALEEITEDSIVNELHERHKKGSHYTFIGDILLYLNPNKDLNIYSIDMHVKYQLKSRSENAPHIYSVGDSAYQDALHHEEQQHIIFSGETCSGKTTNFKHLINHLLYLGLSPNKVGDKILASLNILHAMGNAATPVNNNSTRHVLQAQITYANSGKVSGAIFWLYQLEKWRVTGNGSKQHANFHIFYYFYDWLESTGSLDKYKLDSGRFYKYLRQFHGDDDDNNQSAPPPGPREKPEENIKKFEEIQKNMNDLEFESAEQDLLWKVLAAILLLGEVDFKGDSEGKAEIKNTEIANKVAQLLDVDEKKFSWALCNYCLIQSGTAVKRHHTVAEAKEATHVLARGMYFRIVDWLVNMINVKLSFSRAVFGDKFCVSALDLFGFECYQKNGLEQLFVNTLNEQFQYHYNQRVFVWEMQEQEEEQITLQPLQFYDNKPTLDELMNKPDGLLYIIDEANKNNQGADFIIEKLQNNPKGPRVRMSTTKDFCVAHYTGKVSYDTNDITEKNRDFLPPEMIETLRQSNNSVIRALFTNQLSRSGNLTTKTDQNVPVTTGNKKKWGAALVAEKQEARKYNTQSQGEYSQTRRMRTASAVFRASSLEVMRSLASGQKDISGSTHFVRCIRADLSGQPLGFQPEIVRQQLRAVAVIDTARARQKGYSHRVTFSEFIRRYKFLAFDFDENVEVTKDNCRLLLVRLKMEGWAIGKAKVFLRYYNEEYLSRLYETQVKKIVKVQSMMRAFLAKRNVAGKLLKQRQDSVKKEASRQNSEQKSETEEGGGKNIKQSKAVVKAENLSEAEAAVIIQKQYRGYQARKQFGPILHSGKLDEETAMLMKQYCKKWRAQSLFQVLLLYRAARHQDLVYMSQQAHLFNQNVVSGMLNNNKEKVTLNTINCDLKAREFIGRVKQPVRKLPFRLNDFDYCDSSFLCNTMAKRTLTKEVPWDAPFKRITNRYYFCSNQDDKKLKNINCNEGEVLNFIETPYCRDPYSAEELYRGQQYRKGDWNYSKKKERINSLKKTKAPPVPDSAMKSNRGQLPVTDKSGYSNQFNYKEPFDFYEMNYGMSSNDGNRRGSSNFDPLPSNFNSGGVSGYVYNSKNSSPCNSPVPKSRVAKEPAGHSNYGYQSPDHGLSIYGNNNREPRQPANSCANPKQINNNPIRELELLGKQAGYHTNDCSDEPPYNFQAMLRKTNHNRASLRRSPELELSFKNNHAYKNIPEKDIMNSSNIDNSRSGFQSNRGYSNVVYNSSAERPYYNNHPNQFDRQDSRNVLNTKNYNASRPPLKETREHESFSSTTEVAEIAPGIIVEGQVADL